MLRMVYSVSLTVKVILPSTRVVLLSEESGTYICIFSSEIDQLPSAALITPGPFILPFSIAASRQRM